MTDKQIIIDDVDVSGCNRLNTFPMRYGIEPHEICLTSIEQWGGQEKYCKDRPNCYYKQLKRKEQECEELNKWLPIVTRLEEQFKSHEKAKSIGYKTYAEQIFTELDQLKEDYAELEKRHNDSFEQFKQLKAENEELKNLNTRLDNQRETYWKEYQKLKQALTEIKEIAYELTNEEYTDFIESKQEQILQKCEVLDE